MKAVEAYVCKVTSVGQITLPKNIREEMGVGEDDYVVIERVGDAYVLRKLQGDRRLLSRVRERIRKSGVTEEKLRKIVEEESEAAWRSRHEGSR